MRLRLLLSFLSCSLAMHAQFAPEAALLTVEAMQSDFSYLRGKLETTHPGMYKRRTREQMSSILDSVFNSIRTPLTRRDFYKKIAFTVSETRCEHSYSNPGDGYESMVKKWQMLPFQLFFPEGNPFVVVNGTTDQSIEPGDEVLSINGKTTDSIRQAIYPYLPADGFIRSAKDHYLSSLNFNVAYNQFIEEATTYSVVIRKKDGRVIEREFTNGLDFGSINKNALANPVNRPVLEASRRGDRLRKQPFRLDFEKNHPVAIMTVRTFSADKKTFRKKIDGFFAEISKKQPSDLVIDLSYNGGGEEELAAWLMSYLVDTPTRFMKREYLIDITDSTLAMTNIPAEIQRNKYAYIDSMKDGISTAKISELAMELKVMERQINGYRGRVWIYANGGTASAASTFCAVAKSNGRAVIVGEETAGSFSGGGTVIGLDLTLPHSGIRTHTSMVYQEFATSGQDPTRGVQPDIIYRPVYAELIGQNREWIELILSERAKKIPGR
ncbi:MAG: hypothetical protein EOO09_12680 [Chitinophagaceae bacterium]|nr:MAG: hypothetical protein EOO09_12680 [Chitinophagaceae bacterium]